MSIYTWIRNLDGHDQTGRAKLPSGAQIEIGKWADITDVDLAFMTAFAEMAPGQVPNAGQAPYVPAYDYVTADELSAALESVVSGAGFPAAAAGQIAKANGDGTWSLIPGRGAASGLAPLGSDSKVDPSYLPSIALVDTFPVASQSAMLALSAQTGDVAIRSDVAKSFILAATPPTTLGNWKELLSPDATAIAAAAVAGIPADSTAGSTPSLRSQTAQDARYQRTSQLDSSGNAAAHDSLGDLLSGVQVGKAGSAGWEAPAGWPIGGTSTVALVAGTQYFCRAEIDSRGLAATVNFTLTTAGADDTILFALHDQDGQILGSGSATGILNSTGPKVLTIPTAVAVEPGDTIHASILVPAITGAALNVRSHNPATGNAFRARGSAVGLQDAGCITGQTAIVAVTNATVTNAPSLFIGNIGRPIRAFRGLKTATTRAPWQYFSGLNEGAQLAWETSIVRVPGTRSAKCTVRPGDVEPTTSTTGERCENSYFNSAFEPVSVPTWYAKSTFLPTSFPDPVPAHGTGSTWGIVWQFHCGFSGISPPWALQVDGGVVSVRMVAGEISNTGLSAARVESITLGPLRRNVWLDTVVRQVWDINNGETELWWRWSDEYRFRKGFTRRGIPTLQKAYQAADSAAPAPFMKAGFYRSADDTNTSVVYDGGVWRGMQPADVMGVFGRLDLRRVRVHVRRTICQACTQVAPDRFI